MLVALVLSIAQSGCLMGGSFSLGGTSGLNSTAGPKSGTAPASQPTIGPGNGEGYEGIRKFRAYEFAKEPASCGLPYVSWMEWDPATQMGAIYPACSASPSLILRPGDVEMPTLYGVGLAARTGSSEWFEILDPRLADTYAIPSNNLAVSWCRWASPTNAQESVDIVVRGIGGISQHTATIRYALTGSNGMIVTGVKGPFPVTQIEYINEAIYTAPGFWNKNVYDTPRGDGTVYGDANFDINGVPFVLDMRCRFRVYY